MEIFKECKIINKFIENNNENQARNSLIKLLDYLKNEKLEHTPIINNLIRQTGLYPYINTESADWNDKLVYEMFKVDIGDKGPVTLHREQSRLLKKLLQGKDIAVSAPTSFGKSFVIDSFISIKRPSNIMIIVPTIALTDETRRRIQRKFGYEYKIITTSDVELDEKNIFIFPQERAISYINVLDSLDMLVVDEFYKASSVFDKERSSSLLKAIIKLGKISSQKYYLAPNITKIKDNPFTDGMEFLPIDFNTVVLEKNELYKTIKNEKEKSNELLKIVGNNIDKTLIYAGTYSEIKKVSKLLSNQKDKNELLLQNFSHWLSKNYASNWDLTNLVKQGIGIHNGQLHRCLSQIQVKLFEESYGLNIFISTSSIIEGVNTSTEKVVIWRSKNGSSNLDSFSYKNILGRSGRMFKHFIGKVYILDEPPKDEDTQLTLEIPEENLADFDDDELKEKLTQEQIYKIIEYKETMNNILGKDEFKKLLEDNSLQNNLELIQKIAFDMDSNPKSWNGLNHLNSDDIDKWDDLIYKIVKFQSNKWGIPYSKFVKFIKVLSYNSKKSIPSLLSMLEEVNLTIDDFFKLERLVTFNFSSLVSDIDILQKIILKRKGMDISYFASRVSHAFLPSVVYLLEEYGLPRILSKKIYKYNLIDFTNKELNIHSVLGEFKDIGIERMKSEVLSFDEFDIYILEYFFEGIIND